jgi:amidase
MTEFNEESYIEGQIRKQHVETIKTKSKVDLKIDNLDTIDVEKYQPFIIGQSIRQIQESIKNGHLTYDVLVSFYLNRIQKFVAMNAVLELNPKCYEEALNKTYSDDHDLLYGMPILIKANIGTEDMTTSAGVAALRNLVCDEDADLVKKLKSKGAIILGKTNLSEWANFMSTESSNGYSALGGQTINPYGQFDVGGSSSGSGVAASLQLAAATIGTETAGSIIYPSSQNGIVGLKPTLGLISQDRVIPISETHDTAGPMTHCVDDTILLMEALTELREDSIALDQLKIGIIANEPVKGMYRPDDQAFLNNLVDEIKAHVNTIEEMELNTLGFETQVFDILKYEFREGVKSYLTTYAPSYPVQNLNDIIEFNKGDLNRYAPYNQELIVQSATEVFDPKTINQQILENRRITRLALDEALAKYDVLMTLSNYCTSIYAPAGYPAVTMPGGLRNNGEPLGFTLIGKEASDMRLLSIAKEMESVLNKRVAPKEGK